MKLSNPNTNENGNETNQSNQTRRNQNEIYFLIIILQEVKIVEFDVTKHSLLWHMQQHLFRGHLRTFHRVFDSLIDVNVLRKTKKLLYNSQPKVFYQKRKERGK
jgi:hypothetical protein